MIIVGFTSGLSVLAAQRFGMGRIEDLKYILAFFSLALGALFLVVCAVGAVFVEDILVLMDTPANIFLHAKHYLQIMFAGIPFLVVYNTFCAVLRGLGDSRAPFVSVLVCSVINVVLDLIFVAGLRWGTGGAAIATVLSQIAMTVYLVCYAVWRYPVLRPGSVRDMFNRGTAGEGTRFGLPPAIQSGTTSFGNIILQRFMNGFGDQIVAAVTTAYRVDTVLLLPIINFGSGIATVAAQNIGPSRPGQAGAEDRGGDDRRGVGFHDPLDCSDWEIPDCHVWPYPGIGGDWQTVFCSDCQLLCGVWSGHGGAGLSGGAGGHDLLRYGGNCCPAGAHLGLLRLCGGVWQNGDCLCGGLLLGGAVGTVPVN